ncbi:MAG: hypothetical protein GY765_00515 [bacterium]|nr:hypothetical protein [bacterium]
MSPISNFKCLHCGSTEMCFGYQGAAANVFVPNGLFTIHGYKTRAYICLDCGVMGHYMPKDKLERMKQRLESQFD